MIGFVVMLIVQLYTHHEHEHGEHEHGMLSGPAQMLGGDVLARSLI